MRRAPLAFALFLASCVSANAAGSMPSSEAAPDPRRFFPLEAGMVWSYEVDAGEGEKALGTVRVLETTAEGARMATNGRESDVYLVDAEGVRRVGDTGYVLRAPLRVGATFLTAGGREARVEELDARVRTGMGEIEGCVRIVARSAAAVDTIETVYCPEVGVAWFAREVSFGGEETERIEATLLGLVHTNEARQNGTSGTTVEIRRDP